MHKRAMKNLPEKPVTDQERRATFDREHKVMTMFSDNAKTYIQLSGAALTLTFAHQILHIPAEENIANKWMILMWACFLFTIIAGAFYQYLAAKFMEASLEWEHSGAWDWLEAGTIYGVMLATFYVGASTFTIYAIFRLGHP
jgi:hypothetical protein